MKRTLSYKLLFFIFLAVLAALLVPLLVVGGYAVPCADDYSYGFEAHKVFTETGSVVKALFTGARHVAEVYEIWQGTFSAIFLFSVQPAVFGEKLYALTAPLMLAALTAGSFALCMTLFPKVFGADKYASGAIAAAVTIACTQFLPSPVQGFFWYNGAVYYTFFYGLSLLTFALGIRSVRDGRGGALLCLLCAFLGGGNYVTALGCVIVGVSSWLLLLLRRDRRRKRLLLPLLCLLAAFAVSIAAPGNAIRQATVETHPTAFEAILLSFKNCLAYSREWFSLPLIGVLIMTLPLLWQSAGNSRFAFRFPLLVSAYSFCLLSAMFCPPIYALGNVGEFRLLNILYFAYVLGWFVNAFYWAGWLCKKLGKRSNEKGARLVPTLIAAGICAALCFLSVVQGTGFTSVGAVGLLRSGEAAAFHETALSRLDTLTDPSVADAVLEDYPTHPYLLFYDDISVDPTDWHNIDMASFYGKNSVTLAPRS